MIPYAIMSASLHFSDHTDAIRILDLSADSFTFRLPDPLPAQPDHVLVSFYLFSENRRESIRLSDFETEELPAEDPAEDPAGPFCTAYRLITEDASFLQLSKKLSREYEQYIHRKLEEEAADLSEAMTGYPAAKEESFAADWETQRDHLFRSLHPDPDWEMVLSLSRSGLALCPDCPSLWEAFCKAEDLPAFMAGYYKRRGFSEHPLSRFLPTTVYIGNEFCFHLFPEPDSLERILKKAEAFGLRPVVVLPPVPQAAECTFHRRLTALSSTAVREIIVNDWGTAAFLSEHFGNRFELTAGVLLNRRRKDPRLAWKGGSASPEARKTLSENSFCASFFTGELKKSFHMTGAENESCGYPYVLPSGLANDLILPFYQTNTAGFCTLKAYVENGSRGRQTASHTGSCPYWCESNCFLYPEFLSMAGIGNSLFGFDRRILEDSAYLKHFTDQGVRRIVLRLL